MRWIGTGLQALVGLVFIVSGTFMLADPGSASEDFQLASWFLVLTGILEIAAGLGLIAGFWRSRLVLPSGLLLVAIMAGALVVHFRVDDPMSYYISPAVLLILSGIISAIAFWKDHELRDGLAKRIAVTFEDTERRHSSA